MRIFHLVSAAVLTLASCAAPPFHTQAPEVSFAKLQVNFIT